MAETKLKEYRIKLTADLATHKIVKARVEELFKALEDEIPQVMLEGDFYIHEMIVRDPKNNHLFGLESMGALEARMERQGQMA